MGLETLEHLCHADERDRRTRVFTQIVAERRQPLNMVEMQMAQKNMPYRSLFIQRQSGADRPGIHHHGVVDKKSTRPGLVKSCLFYPELLRPMTAQHTDLHLPTSYSRVRFDKTELFLKIGRAHV